MSQSQFIMVLIIKHIDEICKEGVYIIKFGEIFKDMSKFFMECRLGELDFSHVEGTDTRNLIGGMNDCGCFPLGFRKNDVDEILSWSDHGDLFEVVIHDFFGYEGFFIISRTILF